MKKNCTDTIKLAWENFTETGRIGYYLLYRALEGDENDKGNRYRNKE